MSQAKNENQVERTEARLDALEGWQDWVRDHVIDRIDDLEEAIEERDERIEELESRVDDLQAQLEMLDGLADDESSTPQKRAVDLARAMIRQAKTRPDGRITKYYKEVKEDLATLGHEGLHDPQAFTAMEDVSEAPGFGETKVTRDGQQVKAVGLNLDELDEEAAINEIKNENRGGTGPENRDGAN